MQFNKYIKLIFHNILYIMSRGGLMALFAYGPGDTMPSCNYSNNYSHNSYIQNKKLNENNKHRAKNIKKTIKFKNFMNHNKYD
jgi:hypothetical protein